MNSEDILKDEELKQQKAPEEPGDDMTEETGEAPEETEAGTPEEELRENEELPEEEKAEEPDEESGEAGTAPGKKSFFKKKEKKKDPKEEKIAELTDRLQRLMAEFDNFRKRTEKEKASMYDMGASAAIEKILPVVDNFERGLSSVPEDQREGAVYTGMDMIYKQLVKTLTDLGVEPMNAKGSEFDPNLHNAVMQVENEELPENTVAEELMKGYTYKGNVLRHAMVSVVK